VPPDQQTPYQPPRGLIIARVAGIELNLDPSWFLSLLLLSFVSNWFIVAHLIADPSSPLGMLLSVGFGLAISACIVFHEFAHAVIARVYGMRVRRITLFLFGGVAQIEHEAPRPSAEFAVALAGPLASIVLATTLAGVARLFHPASSGLPGPWGRMAYLNLLVAIFNLLPAFPMDGGRLLRSVLWALLKARARATRYAVLGGRGFAALLVAWGVLVVGSSAFRDLSGLYTILIGVFLYNAAGTAGRVEGGERPNAPGLALEDDEDADVNIVTGRSRDER